MIFDKNDKVVSMKTSEFATVLQRKETIGFDDSKIYFYEVRLDTGAIVAWLEKETALWHKPSKVGWTTLETKKPETPAK